MFTDLPIVPRCADGMPSVFVFHRSRPVAFRSYGARGSLADFRVRVDELLDGLCRGPRGVIVLSVADGGKRDDEAGLGTLMRAIDTQRCDALIVESLSRISRDAQVQREFMAGLGQTGVRLLALDDHVDSAVDSLVTAFSTGRVDRPVAHVAIALNGSS